MPLLLLILTVITVAYEIAKKKNSVPGIFLLVGLGYPLRFVVGVIAAIDPQSTHHMSVSIIIYLLLLYLFGVFASMLSWCSEVTRRMEESQRATEKLPQSYKKKHFEYFQRILEERFLELWQEDKDKARWVLRVYSRLEDPWNIVMFLSIVIAAAGHVIYINNELVLILCLTADILLASAIISNNRVFSFLNFISVLMYLLVLILGVLFNGITYNAAGVVIIEGMMAIAYWFLRYQPQLKQIDWKLYAERFKRNILGDDICDKYSL